MEIAIDGPAGSGKSTIAKRLAKDLGIIYLDTGAMYRAVTLYVIENDLESDLESLRQKIEDLKIDFAGESVFLNGRDVSKEIRSRQVSNLVSRVSALDFVREAMTKRQQAIARENSVVMDGRDIGTTVLPEADYKFYLDATPECRATRRAGEMGISPDSDEFYALMKEIVRRDRLDSTREISPLRRPQDAFYLNTDDYSIDEVLSIVKKEIQ